MNQQAIPCGNRIPLERMVLRVRIELTILPLPRSGSSVSPGIRRAPARPEIVYLQAIERYTCFGGPGAQSRLAHHSVTPKPVMEKRLTEIAIKKPNPEAGKRLEIFDLLIPSLALRITEGDTNSWSVMHRSRAGVMPGTGARCAG